MREFALIWQALPKVVFSRTLDSVEGANTTLARDDLRAELISLQESVRGDVAVGGAALAVEAALDLIAEYRLFVHPVAVGGGMPFFPRDHRASSYAAILGARLSRSPRCRVCDQACNPSSSRQAWVLGPRVSGRRRAAVRGTRLRGLRAALVLACALNEWTT